MILKKNIPVKGKDAARTPEGTPVRIGKLPGFPFPISESLPRPVLPWQNLSPLSPSRM